MRGRFYISIISRQKLFSTICSKNLGNAIFRSVQCTVLLTCVSVLSAFIPAAAETISTRGDLALPPVVPAAYGEVVYRINELSAKQLYIVGISHRAADTLENNDDTVQVQTEIFRIGQWLNRNRELDLLLPEGYFNPQNRSALPRPGQGKDAGDLHPAAGPTNDYLHTLLTDESGFVNAEMLLMEHCKMRACQVEEREIYDSVLDSLRRLGRNRSENGLSGREIIAELQYLQQLRTARQLQKIPALVESEFLHGTIRGRFAMLTIGLNHIRDIIRHLETRAIMIKAPVNTGNKLEAYNAELALLQEGYGVTIIIPRTLADDRRLLRMTNLDRILLAESDMPDAP